MPRLLFIVIFISAIIPKASFAQRKANSNCSISLNSYETEREVKNYLTRKFIFIQIRFHQENSFTQDSLFLAWEQSKSIRLEEKTTIQLVDSVIVKLSNGLSWNIKEGPPQKPANFVFKLFTKKAKTDQGTIDYIKYLEFCSRWGDSKKTCEIIDEYSVYTKINIDGTNTFRAKYDIVYQPTKKVSCQEVILIDRK